MTLQRDRLFLPAPDEAMKVRMTGRSPHWQTLSPRVIAAADGSPERVHAVVALALDFWTWRRLAAEGLSDEVAAASMVTAAEAAAGARVPSRR